MECTRRIEHVNEVCISAPFGGMGGSPPHGDVGRGTRTIPRRNHDFKVKSSTPCGGSGTVIDAGREWRKASSLLRVLKNMHSPQAGLDEGRVATDGQARMRRL